jgi:SAM-dependent methyltransferase
LRIAAPRRGAMLSDGAPCGVALERLHCRACGAGWLPPRQAARLPRRIFGAAYGLGAAPPTAADIARAAGYATRIAALWRGAPPCSVLDVGCGNGALLAALGAHWPVARRSGVEPAPRVAAAARGAGLAVAPTLRPGRRAALVVAVNVVEHTPDPRGFLAALRRAVAPGGAAIVICPDGSLPWLELLMADHRWSFTPAALARVAAAAGFRVLAAEPQPGGFQALLLRPALRRLLPRARGAVPADARRRYLGAWRALDAALAARRGARRLVCFGVGEAARLLRLHAPATWAGIAALTADDPAGAAALGKPVIAPAALRADADDLLLAQRPGAQPALAARFAGSHVIRWDDLVRR